MVGNTKIGGGVQQGVGQTNYVDPDIAQPHATGVEFNPQQAPGGVNLGDIAAAGQHVTTSNTATLTGTGGSAGQGETESFQSGNTGSISQ